MTLRLRVLPRYPSRINGVRGITAERDGPDVVVGLDLGSLIRVPAVLNPDRRFFAVWNEDDDSYSIMSFTDTFNAVIDTTGLMSAPVYDPQGIEDDAFDRANHTGEQGIGTVTGLQAALDAKAPSSTAVTLTGTQTLTNKTLTAPVVNAPQGEFLRGDIRGLTLSNNGTDQTNDIDIAAGSAASDGATPVLMALASAMTKRLDAAWAVGSGSGGWLDGSSMPDGTGHVFLIQRSDTGAVDVGMSASLNPSLPTNYDRKRRIGSIIRESGAIVLFTQHGDYFSRAVKIERDSTASLVSTTISLGVPSGIVVRPVISSQLVIPASSNIAFSVGNGGGSGTSYLAQTAFTGTGESSSDVTQCSTLLTNTARQIYIEISITSGSITIFRLRTHGWFDTRDR